MNPARKSTADSSDIRSHLLHAADRLSRIIDNDNNEPLCDINSLRDDQTNVFNDVGSYLIDLATDPNPASAPMARIILPPRTGKTVIASTVTSASGLLTTFIVPTTTLVFQTAAEFAKKLPYEQIGVFCGERKHLVQKGVNVTTYHMLQHHHTRFGSLPDEIAMSGLIFADEGHHAMTDARQNLLRIGFADEAPRIALTATANYSEERALAKYFPRLLHEITVSEAIDLELLAPVRLWLYEVDIDATHVQLRNGDLDPEQLGSLMSAAPCFEAARVHRYSEENEKLSALICCSSVNQAKSLKTYLDLRQPKGKPKAALLFGDTTPNQRQLALDAFEAGTIDTIINVGILIEGWSSPRCKLLIDLSPSLSQVRATQKFFRPMTKDGDAEARIIMIMPQNLRHMPVLPMDVFGTQEEYEPGEEISRFKRKGAHKQKPLIKKVKEVESVELVSNLRLSCMFAPPKLNKKDLAQIRTVMLSNPEFDADLIALYPTLLKRIPFNHTLFNGIGSHLARYIGLPLKRNAAFQRIFGRLFPEAVGNAILKRDATLQKKRERETYLGAELPEMRVYPELLLGEYTHLLASESAENSLAYREILQLLSYSLYSLTLHERAAIELHCMRGLTLDATGKKRGFSRERIRQIIAGAMRKLRQLLEQAPDDPEEFIVWHQRIAGEHRQLVALRATDKHRTSRYMSYTEASLLAQKASISLPSDYIESSVPRFFGPFPIPTYPQLIYRKEWTSWHDFLGMVSFEELRKLTREALAKHERRWRPTVNYDDEQSFNWYMKVLGKLEPLDQHRRIPPNPEVIYEMPIEHFWSRLVSR